MNKLVYMACGKKEDICLGKCKSNDCEIFWQVRKKLQSFGGRVLEILVGDDIDVVKLRQDERYRKAVKELHWGGLIVENTSLKKSFNGIEENIIKGLLEAWAQK